MKVLIARLNHETNTFSPVPTPLAAFGPDGPTFGEQAYRDNKGMRTAMSAFIDLAEQAGATLVTPVSASANPSGPVDAEAYTTLTQCIVDAAPGCDAILLDLHGAMVAQNSADGEGDLLVRLRAAAPGVPIGVALDLHANVTPAMVGNADVIVGFKTYPHIDMYETGEHAGRLLFDLLAGRSKPAMRWHPLPLMAHTLRSASFTGAMQRAIDAAREAEKSESLAVSIFAGFSLSDIEAPCMSVVAVDAQSPERAQATADRIAARMWEEREAFIYRSEPLAESVARAKAIAQGATRPVLLLDHGDNCMSGGSCDTMDVLQEALAQGLDGIGVGPLCDPQAVAELIAAGEGADGDGGAGQQGVAGRHRPVEEARHADRHGAHRLQRRIRDHRPDLHRPAQQHGPHGAVRHRRGAHRGDRANAGALGHRRLRMRWARPAQRAVLAAQVAHVLPAGVRADLGRPGRVRQPGRDQFGLRPVPVFEGAQARVSARRDLSGRGIRLPMQKVA